MTADLNSMKFVALIRGVGPGNPNMHQSKLKEFFESVGFKNVKPIISSGNVIFESNLRDEQIIEQKIEDELPKKLGFFRMTIVRSEIDLKKFVSTDPFKNIQDEKPNYLLVTFFKDRRPEIPTVLDMNSEKSTDFMAKIDKIHNKEVTTRTWKTVHRILKAMENM